MSIDFKYQLIEINKEKSCDFDLYRFLIQIEDDFYSTVFNYYQLLSEKT